MRPKPFVFAISVLCILVAGCGHSWGTKRAEDADECLSLGPNDFLYKTTDVFSQCYDEDVLVELRMYNEYEIQSCGTGGPDHILLTRGNDTETYPLEFKRISTKENRSVITFDIYEYDDDYERVRAGTVEVFDNTYYGDLADSIAIKMSDGSLLEFKDVMSINCFEKIWDADLETIGAISLYSQLAVDWPLCAKNLVLYLKSCCEFEELEEIDFSPLKETWTVTRSSDGALLSLRVPYDICAGGYGSILSSEILLYESEDDTHFIIGFDKWALSGTEDNYFLDNTGDKISVWKTGNGPIYLVEHRYENLGGGEKSESVFSFLGAFRIVDGSLIPAKVFKTKHETLSSIKLSCASEEAPGFKVDKAKGVLGVPLIETDDYLFHGKYLVYDWNPDTGMFEYNGKKQPLP